MKLKLNAQGYVKGLLYRIQPRITAGGFIPLPRGGADLNQGEVNN